MLFDYTGSSTGPDQSVVLLTDEIYVDPDSATVYSLNSELCATTDQSLDGTVVNGTEGSCTVGYLPYSYSNYDYYSNFTKPASFSPSPASASASSSSSASSSAAAGPQDVYVLATRPWSFAVERLLYYTSLVAMQASTEGSCKSDST